MLAFELQQRPDDITYMWMRSRCSKTMLGAQSSAALVLPQLPRLSAKSFLVLLLPNNTTSATSHFPWHHAFVLNSITSQLSFSADCRKLLNMRFLASKQTLGHCSTCHIIQHSANGTAARCRIQFLQQACQQACKTTLLLLLLSLPRRLRCVRRNLAAPASAWVQRGAARARLVLVNGRECWRWCARSEALGWR